MGKKKHKTKENDKMIKFEEHDGLLFKMLDEPVPLTPDTELPVLVRMIQDDTMLGKANKRICLPDKLAKKIICSSSNLTDDGLFLDSIYAYRYEIIGTLVKEGSKEWALYQLPVSDATQYKAGDWVEVEETTTGEIEHHIVERINTFCPVSPEYLVDDMWFNHDGMEIIPLDWTFSRKRITRKLDPSEVIVHIGCLSGTIAKSCDPNYFLMLHSRPITDCNYSMIRFSAIDTETCEIVESLLEAQKNKENA
jgi:hypothetical protein